MAATTVDQVRRALTAQVSAAISGLNCYPYLPAGAEIPAFMILPTAPDASDVVMGNSATISMHEFEALLIVNLAGAMEIAQQQLCMLTDSNGDNSISSAMLADRTLGGIAISLFCDNWSRESVEEYGGVEYLGQRLPFRVWVE